MFEDGDKEKIDAQFSMLDARARKRRRTGLIVTVALTAVTGILVLRLARDIIDKQAQVSRAEQARGELDQKLKSEQEKLDAAVRTRAKLESEIKDLEATKRSYQNRILSEKDAHNMGGDANGSAGKTPQGLRPVPNPETPVTQTNPGIAEDLVDARALLIEESGKAPTGFFIKPVVNVVPGIGNSGKEIFKVLLALEIPEAQRANVERVTYHLSPKYYLRNTIEGGEGPSFEAKFNVFACESTVLGRVHLRGGTTVAVDFDWCRESGWPLRKKEPVMVAPEDEKSSANRPAPTSPPANTISPLPSPGGRVP
ncbi:MAG TPA: hypothetical protein PK156_00505 [Polyangium sp.]|nr:hypothetical protein [Polyangium sp.]